MTKKTPEETPTMSLDAFIVEQGWTNREAADRLDAGTGGDVWAYRRGEKIPRPDRMSSIYRGSGGVVDPNTFYDLTL